MRYDTLDALAADYPTGTRLRFRTRAGTEPLATVLGVTWSLPFEVGGRDEPALVIEQADRRLGNVYPHEVVASDPAPDGESQREGRDG